LRGQHRLGGTAAACGVGQRGDAEPVQQIQHAGAAFGVDATHRDGGQFGARRDERLLEHAQVRGAAGPHDQPRAELTSGNCEFCVR
jgi:hypothetical protein